MNCCCCCFLHFASLGFIFEMLLSSFLSIVNNFHLVSFSTSVKLAFLNILITRSWTLSSFPNWLQDSTLEELSEIVKSCQPTVDKCVINHLGDHPLKSKNNLSIYKNSGHIFKFKEFWNPATQYHKYQFITVELMFTNYLKNNFPL